MPTLRKLLARFSRTERLVLEPLIEKIISLNWRGLDIKKLQGYDDMFRARKGKIRIVFRRQGAIITIIDMNRRSEKTYKL